MVPDKADGSTTIRVSSDPEDACDGSFGKAELSCEDLKITVTAQKEEKPEEPQNPDTVRSAPH